MASTVKRNAALLDAAESFLLLVDFQERFRAAIPDFGAAADRARILLLAANRLGVPVAFTEQYPKALGRTVEELAPLLAGRAVAQEKLAFSALGAPGLFEELKRRKPSQILVAGVEAHVCVLQTVLDLVVNLDAQVYVCADAVASRRAADRDLALRRMEQHGAQAVGAEMVLFEWLQAAGTPEFKEVQALIK